VKRKEATAAYGRRQAEAERVLTDQEIQLLWEALDLENRKVDTYRLTKLALKSILLTGQRPGEVCGMTWAEIDGETWNIPAIFRSFSGESLIWLLR
jgi:integrase